MSAPTPAPTGDDLRRHMRDHHNYDVHYLRGAPDAGLAVEHEMDHEEGADHDHA